MGEKQNYSPIEYVVAPFSGNHGNQTIAPTFNESGTSVSSYFGPLLSRRGLGFVRGVGPSWDFIFQLLPRDCDHRKATYVPYRLVFVWLWPSVLTLFAHFAPKWRGRLVMSSYPAQIWNMADLAEQKRAFSIIHSRSSVLCILFFF